MAMQRAIHALNDMLLEIKPFLKIDFAHCEGFLKDFNRNKQMEEEVQKEIKDGESQSKSTSPKKELRPE